VARVIAHQAASGVRVCSPNTASYCNARNRLRTDVLRTLTKRTAQELLAGTVQEWKWNGRNVFIADGSHVSMPDTAQARMTAKEACRGHRLPIQLILCQTRQNGMKNGDSGELLQKAMSASSVIVDLAASGPWQRFWT
jgi:hypothetical protein